MIILKPVATPQEVEVYAREHTGNSYEMFIIDESKNTINETTETGTVNDGLLEVDVTYDFQEGRYYVLKIYHDGNLVNYSKIYVTGQTGLDKYSVLEGYYTQPQKERVTYITKGQ